MSGIKRVLHHSVAEALIGLLEGLAVLALLDIKVDQPLDRIDDAFRRKAGAGPLADGGGFGRIAAQRDLIGFRAGLLQAENADVADMMVAAGIDAAGNLDADRADLLLQARLGEALGDFLGDRNGSGGRQRAIVEARTGDDIRDQLGIGGGEAAPAPDPARARRDRLSSHSAG